MSATRPYHHPDLRAALLRAALALLRRGGVRPLTLRAVARRAGVSHTAPYRHFHDKSELLAAIAEEGFERLTAAMRAAAAAAGADAPFGSLRNAGVAYVEFAQQQPQHFALMFALQPGRNRPAARAAQAAAARCFSELVTLVAACSERVAAEGPAAQATIPAGQTTLPTPPTQAAALSTHTAALLAWAQVHGLAELALRRQLRVGKRELHALAELAAVSIGRGLGLERATAVDRER